MVRVLVVIVAVGVAVVVVAVEVTVSFPVVLVSCLVNCSSALLFFFDWLLADCHAFLIALAHSSILA